MLIAYLPYFYSRLLALLLTNYYSAYYNFRGRPVMTDRNYFLDFNYLGGNERQFGAIKLYQIGRLFCSPDTIIGTHLHGDCFELTIVTDGEGEVVTNDQRLNVGKGDIYFSFPGDFHDVVTSKTNPLKYDFFAFNTDDPKLKSDLGDVMCTLNLNTRIFRDDRIGNLVSQALAELSVNEKYSEEVLSCIFLQAVYYIVRGLKLHASRTCTDDVSNDELLCYRIMNYIDTHIYSLITLGELAAVFNYNYSYLSTTFRNTTKRTMNDYYRSRKLEVARLLLLEGKLSGSQIAEKLNFSSLYSFSKSFKSKFSMAPQIYKKSHRDNS